VLAHMHDQLCILELGLGCDPITGTAINSLKVAFRSSSSMVDCSTKVSTAEVSTAEVASRSVTAAPKAVVQAI